MCFESNSLCPRKKNEMTGRGKTHGQVLISNLMGPAKGLHSHLPQLWSSRYIDYPVELVAVVDPGDCCGAAPRVCLLPVKPRL